MVNLAGYAVERRILMTNPITGLAWKSPHIVQAVDRQVVVDPTQARRPGEASTLRKANLALPASGWGELLSESSTPEAGASWADSGRRREERRLKHRARGETRVVPSPPELTALLHAHLEAPGNGPDRLLFSGVRGGQLAESTNCRV